MRPRFLILWALVLAVLWGGLYLRARRSLRIENHLQRGVALPFVPVGAPVLHRDGRVFLRSADQLFALSAAGQPLWNKRLPEPAALRLVNDALLLVTSATALSGYSLGGEALFRVAVAAAPDAAPQADERGEIYLLDQEGRLLRLGPGGEARGSTSLRLRAPRHLALLPGERLAVAGVSAAGPVLLLGGRGGVVTQTLPLPAPAVALATAAAPGEALAVASGEALHLFGPAGEPRRRVALPAAPCGAPVLRGDGGGAVLLCEPGGATLALFDQSGGQGGGAVRRLAPAERGCPLVLTRGGRVGACFRAAGGWVTPAYQGVLLAAADGGLLRQALPGAVEALTLSAQGAPVAVVGGERYLWFLEAL